MDIALLMDASGSIQQEHIGAVIDFAKALVKQFDIGQDKVRISLVYYQEESHVLLPFSASTELEDILFYLDKLDQRSIGGKTNTFNGLFTLRDTVFNHDGDRPDVRNYVILLTDGPPNMEVESTIPEAIRNQIEGTHFTLVLIGNGLVNGRNYLLLHGIASEPYAANIFNVPVFSDLNRLVPEVTLSLCDGKYVVGSVHR